MRTADVSVCGFTEGGGGGGEMKVKEDEVS